jgi:hypothetical protein
MGRRWIVTAAVLLSLTASSLAAAQPARPALRRSERSRDMTEESREQIAQRRARFERITDEERQHFRERRMGRMRRFARGHALGPAALHQLSRADRVALREQVRSLPEGERRDLRKKLRRFHSLPEAERDELQSRFAVLQSLDSEERQQVHQNARRFREMEPSQRQRLRSAMTRFRGLPPNEQQEWLDRAFAETPEQTR